MNSPTNWPIRRDPEACRRYRDLGVWRDRTIADLAREWAAREPDTEIFLDQPQPVTYASLLADAEALAVSLWDRGLRPGDVVSFQVPNWVEAAVINVAAALLGLVINPIVHIYRGAEVKLTLADCRSRAIFIPATFRNFNYAEMLEEIRADLPDLKSVIVVRGNGEGDAAYEDLVAAGRGRSIDWPKVDPQSVKMIMYTSGTTGRPKGVLHDHNSIARAVAACTEYWGIQKGDVVLMPSPVTHISGYSNGLELPFLSGTRTVLMEHWNAAEAVKLINHHRISGTVAATPFLQELVATARAENTRLPSIRFFACGGAAVPPEIVRQANALFENGRAFRVYGSTETPLITLGWVGPDVAELAATTDGRIIDYDVLIVDDAGNPVPQGQEGEIIARGPAMFLGYADDAQNAEAFTPDGYFRTGDIGLITPDGAVLITGRKKDLIIRGGENISAKEIEDALHLHPDVEEAAVVAMPHARLGEGICAYIIPRVGRRPDMASITAHMATTGLAKQKYPEHVELVDSFPRTASGKIKKDILRKMIAEKMYQKTA
ncbi:AMP-binding protein [Pedomonas sp. V897]|uniref:AMP-binding protein n=1 Tax=Pedomonas sp. V897 TaxID=3446482 RepID=UPI003EDFEE65